MSRIQYLWLNLNFQILMVQNKLSIRFDQRGSIRASNCVRERASQVDCHRERERARDSLRKRERESIFFIFKVE